MSTINPTKRSASEIRNLVDLTGKWWGKRVWASASMAALEMGLYQRTDDGSNYLGGVSKRRDVSSRAYSATAWNTATRWTSEKKTELGVFPSRSKAVNALIDERLRVNAARKAAL
jgi:hypothetical protein